MSEEVGGYECTVVPLSLILLRDMCNRVVERKVETPSLGLVHSSDFVHHCFFILLVLIFAVYAIYMYIAYSISTLM